MLKCYIEVPCIILHNIILVETVRGKEVHCYALLYCAVLIEVILDRSSGQLSLLRMTGSRTLRLSKLTCFSSLNAPISLCVAILMSLAGFIGGLDRLMSSQSIPTCCMVWYDVVKLQVLELLRSYD